jgi:hypothetical protein
MFHENMSKSRHGKSAQRNHLSREADVRQNSTKPACTTKRLHFAAIASAVGLAKTPCASYLSLIDIWPDHQAVSPAHFAGRTFRPFPNIDHRVAVALLRGPQPNTPQ